MPSLRLALATLFLVPCAAAQAPSADADGVRVTTLEAEGNLEARQPVGCVAVDDLGPEVTPADIYPGVGACVEADDVPKAAELMVAAFFRGIYDTQRVEDRTAHQAILMLQEGTLAGMDPAASDALRETVGDMFGGERTGLDGVCGALRAQGPPTYHPRYMIQHGLGAFSDDGGDGLVDGFEPEAVWAEVLASGCSPG